MKKKKPTKLNDLSQLGSVISFKTVDERAYDVGTIGRFERDGDTVKWIPDEIKGTWRIINLPKKDEN